MKEIAWILGRSGSGKETFCRYLQQDPDSELIAELGWRGLSLCVSKASIELVYKSRNDTSQDSRDEILGELDNLADTCDVAVIKHQYIDTKIGRVRDIKRQFSSVQHRAIVLRVPDSVLQARLSERPYWDSKIDFKDYFVHEDEILKKSLSDFDRVDYIDTIGEYKLDT